MGCQSCDSVLAQSIKTSSIFSGYYYYWFMKQQLCLPVCLCMRAWINGILHSPAFSVAPKGVGRQLLKATGESENSDNLKRQTWCTQVSGGLGAVPQRDCGCLDDRDITYSIKDGVIKPAQGFVSSLTGVCLEQCFCLPETSPLHCTFKFAFQRPCERIQFPFFFFEIRWSWR